MHAASLIRQIPQRVAAAALGIALALSVVSMPAPALAAQLDTDIVLGEAESVRQDAANDRPDISARNAIVVGADGTVYFERAADDRV